MSLTELNLFHFFSSVPVKESLSPKHCWKWFSYLFEDFLNSRIIPNEGTTCLHSSEWNIANRSLYIIRYPLHKVKAIFILFTICWSTSLVDSRQRNIEETVNYFPFRGSQAAISYCASNNWWTSSGMVTTRYGTFPLDFNGVKPDMKKWSLRKGIILTWSFLNPRLVYEGVLITIRHPDLAIYFKCANC